MITHGKLITFLRVIEEQSPKEWSGTLSKRGGHWFVEYKPSYPPFQFFIEYNEEMLYVQYVFRDFKVHADCWLALYHLLLRLNEEISLIKFGLTSMGNITLMGELPGTMFSLDSFQNLLRLMVHYLEQLYWEIGLIAESPALAPFLTSQESYLARVDQKAQELVKTISVEEIITDKKDEKAT